MRAEWELVLSPVLAECAPFAFHAEDIATGIYAHLGPFDLREAF
jgi:hypothetical protein